MSAGNCTKQGDHTILSGVIAFLLLLLLLPAATRAQQIDTLALRTHTRYLAGDELLGRGTGSNGEHLAAAYLESELRRLAVRPAASSYLLPVPLRQLTIDSAKLLLRARSDSLVFNTNDFVINTGGERAFQDFAGAAVLLGTVEHALAAPTAGLSGRVLVVLGTLGADAQVLVPRWLKAGVSGVLMLVPDSAQFQLIERNRGEARLYVAAEVDEPIWQAALPMLIGGPALTRALLSDLGADLARAVGSERFAPLPLSKHVHLRVHGRHSAVRANNVMAVIPGRDARLRGQYVLYTAHYDHLGVSTPDARGDSIYNGFSDNAAGVAMLLAIAREFATNPPARSVAFLFFTGEERGLLGSTYYASRPVLPLDSIAAVINLDGGAPSAPPVEWRLAGGTGNYLGPLAQQIAQQHGWVANLSDASPNSDYWPFSKRGVPAVFIIPGNRWEGLTSAQRDALRARWDRYHQASDEYSEQFPFAGLQRYALFAFELGRAAANKPN